MVQRFHVFQRPRGEGTERNLFASTGGRGREPQGAREFQGNAENLGQATRNADNAGRLVSGNGHAAAAPRTIGSLGRQRQTTQLHQQPA